MSSKYPGGIISKTAPTPSGPYSTDTAPGVWTLEQQAYWQKLGQWPTAGNVNPNAFIENLFSTYLYTGNGTTNVITNNIDLSTKNGMVWMKSRSNAFYHGVYDTVRGTGTSKSLYTNTNEAQGYNSTNQNLTAFNADGFTLGATSSTNTINGSGGSMCSWTFREQANFFDIVTWSGNDVSGREIAHSLGSTPGMVIIKSLVTDNWCVWHRGLTAGNYIVLNSTAAQTTAGAVNRYGNGTTTVDPNSTYITVGSNGEVNQTGNNYVAYLFAHDAGGFGLTGTDNVISCGSYTGSGGTTTPLQVTLGYEPQWVLVKPSSGVGNWAIADTMRGMTRSSNGESLFNELLANTSDAENGGNYGPAPTATGFAVSGSGFPNASGTTYIYIAIRRGPMAVPTLGTSVFSGISRSGTGATVSVTGAGFPPDAIITKVRNLNGAPAFWDKLRGPNRALTSNTADAEQTTTTEISSFDQDGFSAGTSSTFYTNASGGYTYINWQLKRAPSFFDEVCYTGTGSATTFSHNLQAVPELMICKRRNISASWIVYSAATGNSAILQLEDTGAVQTSVTNWNNTTPTASVFSVGTQGSVNASGGSYVAYLFATCAGVSKVGSYTGTGTLTTVNCGFTGGARFVLIKRTDAVEAWYVWDTIRGMTDGTDPSLRFNNQSSESNANSVYTIATGFQLLASPSADVNTNGGTYIFLAIA